MKREEKNHPNNQASRFAYPPDMGGEGGKNFGDFLTGK
jgi:hypothetical protein